ncbi:IPT/TIG domain-containing protein [candidate division KSB1 bacterium]|nr:IPT/TIG domain-containing protein [candidate division KSB1 bacterium]
MKPRINALALLLIIVAQVPGHAGSSRPVPNRTTPPSSPVRSPLATIVTLPWAEDFESGGADWTTSGFFHVIADPQTHEVRNPLINPGMVSLPDEGFLPAAHSGNHSLWYGEDVTGSFIGADFDTIQASHSGGTSQLANTGWAISPELDLTTATEPVLTFWTWWEIEGVDVPWFDMMFVEASTDGGLNWLPVGSGSLNPLDDVNANAHVGYSSGGVGETGAWVHHAFLLTGLAGGHGWIRFRFDTVDPLYNGFRGWIIDDIAVTDGTIPGPVITELVPHLGQQDDLVHAHGQNFHSGAQITIGGEACTEVILAEDLAQLIIPNLRRDIYDVMITNPDGQVGICHSCFQVDNIRPPEIQIVSQTWAYVGLPRTITIAGERFDPAAVVTMGGIPVTNLSIVNDQTLTCTTPLGLGLGARPIRIENPNGLFDVCSGCMEIRPWVTLTPPGDLVIAVSSPHVKLNWSPITGIGNEYVIFHGDPAGGDFMDFVGATTDTTFVDSFAVNAAPSPQYYAVRTLAP